MDPISLTRVSDAAALAPAGKALPLAGKPAGRADQIKDAAAEFEALFLRQILKDLRKTASIDGDSSYMTGFYHDMFDEQVAAHLSRAGGIGLAQALRTYLEQGGGR